MLVSFGWWAGRRVNDAARCGVMFGGVAGARGGAGEGLTGVGLRYVRGVCVWMRECVQRARGEAAR